MDTIEISSNESTFKKLLAHNALGTAMDTCLMFNIERANLLLFDNKDNIETSIKNIIQDNLDFINSTSDLLRHAFVKSEAVCVNRQNINSLLYGIWIYYDDDCNLHARQRTNIVCQDLSTLKEDMFTISVLLHSIAHMLNTNAVEYIFQTTAYRFFNPSSKDLNQSTSLVPYIMYF